MQYVTGTPGGTDYPVLIFDKEPNLGTTKESYVEAALNYQYIAHRKQPITRASRQARIGADYTVYELMHMPFPGKKEYTGIADYICNPQTEVEPDIFVRCCYKKVDHERVYHAFNFRTELDSKPTGQFQRTLYIPVFVRDAAGPMLTVDLPSSDITATYWSTAGVPEVVKIPSSNSSSYTADKRTTHTTPDIGPVTRYQIKGMVMFTIPANTVFEPKFRGTPLSTDRLMTYETCQLPDVTHQSLEYHIGLPTVFSVSGTTEPKFAATWDEKTQRGVAVDFGRIGLKQLHFTQYRNAYEVTYNAPVSTVVQKEM